MFALRGLPQAGRQVARVPRQAAVFQQKRGMAGGGGFARAFKRALQRRKKGLLDVVYNSGRSAASGAHRARVL